MGDEDLEQRRPSVIDDDADDAGRRLVARMLEHHGVAALIWRDGAVTWGNAVALDLVRIDGSDPETELLRRLDKGFRPATCVDDLDLWEERLVEAEVAAHRGLLSVSTMAVGDEDDDGPFVLFTFRVPLEEAVDPGQVARLQAMLDSTSDIVTVIDREGRVRISNPAALRLLGLAGADTYGASMFDFIHPEDGAVAADAFDRGVLLGQPVEPFVVRLRMADGEWRHTEVRLTGEVEIDGDQGHVAVVRDITDRVRRDAEMVAHQRRVELLVENIDDVIVILGSDLSVRWASPGIERFVDAPAYTNVGESAFNDMHPDDVPVVLAALEAAMRSPDRRSQATLRLRHQRRGWHLIEASIVNRLDDPAVEGLVCTLRQVTGVGDDETAALEVRRNEREEVVRLRETDRLKDRFLATVSHELRTPLTSVRGFSNVLVDQWGELAPESKLQLVERISANARAMEDMIEQLLDFSRLQAGRVEVHTEVLELDDVVAHMVDTLAIQLAHHTVQVDTGGFCVLGDRRAFDHVLRNLLTNAARYSAARTQIDVVAERDGDVVRLHVVDRGIGIAEKDRGRVFQSFYQSAPGVTERRGTGIGLNVARRYAQLQSGRLELQSTLGEGSTFTFTLPAAD
jgi:PAS domain S-box-containing protein